MEIQILGLKEFERDLGEAVKILPTLTRKAMDKSTQHIKNEVQDTITDEKITFQGGLQQSVHGRVISDFKGEVYVGKNYGIFVEKGTRPHWPPPEPIERWAAIKLGQPGIGFLIQRKIARKGTKAHPYFLPSVEKSIPRVGEIFAQVPEVLVKYMAGKK